MEDFEKLFLDTHHRNKDKPQIPNFVYKIPDKTDYSQHPVIIQKIAEVRQKIRHNIGIRGTTIEYLEEAINNGKISNKKVDFWEDDYGKIAHFEIPISNSAVDHYTLFHHLQVSLMKNISYGLQHSQLPQLNTYENFKYSKKINIANVPNSKFPSLIIFFIDQRITRNRNNQIINNNITQNNTIESQYNTNYLNTFHRVNFMGKRFLTFNEGKSIRKGHLSEHSHQTIKINKKMFQEIDRKLSNPSTEEYKFYKEILNNLTDEIITKENTAYNQALIFFLAKKIFPTILEKMELLSKENQTILNNP